MCPIPPFLELFNPFVALLVRMNFIVWNPFGSVFNPILSECFVKLVVLVHRSCTCQNGHNPYTLHDDMCFCRKKKCIAFMRYFGLTWTQRFRILLRFYSVIWTKYRLLRPLDWSSKLVPIKSQFCLIHSFLKCDYLWTDFTRKPITRIHCKY